MTTAQKVIGALTIISVLLFGSIIYVSSQNRELREKITTLEAHYANQELADSATHNPVQSIDEMLFSGQYADALEKYQDLQQKKTYSVNDADLVARISVVRSLIANASSSRVDKPIQAARDSIAKPTSLVEREDPADRSSKNNKDTDSLENKITELNRRLSSRERALEEKEKLKAMAIQGPTGQTIQYVGDTKNGMAHGTGTGVWDATGGTYNGDWQQNKRHGYGVYNWKDGVRYEGEFRQDKREGKGSYYWPSGERYVGLWKNNQRHGHGVLYDKDGNVSFDGNWESDKPKRK
ncbi:MORN repeat-containing protein [Sphingobacterium chungjuense]|uniref:MORN repeat-containing protein n=1 Tax=Sphingobacterium chungjuense TaxID=2675553 RepID=UPI0014076516|nr:hypothetical protein [Sphingobacterium chungjuense]